LIIAVIVPVYLIIVVDEGNGNAKLKQMNKKSNYYLLLLQTNTFLNCIFKTNSTQKISTIGSCCNKPY
jgi:hypothetical protein